MLIFTSSSTKECLLYSTGIIEHLGTHCASELTKAPCVDKTGSVLCDWLILKSASEVCTVFPNCVLFSTQWDHYARSVKNAFMQHTILMSKNSQVLQGNIQNDNTINYNYYYYSYMVVCYIIYTIH